MQRKTNKAAILLFCIGIVGAVYFASLIWIDMNEDRQDEAYYASLPAIVPSYDSDLEQTVENKTTPTTVTNTIPAVNFEAVRAEVPNVIAWIRIDGTVINYPVMHGIDNEYFLTHLPNGKTSKSGSIFIDYRNASDFSDANTLIHGHRMKSGTMFAALKNYSSQAFYERHRTANISTPLKKYELMFIAGYRLNQTVEIPPISFKDEEDFSKYIQDIKRRSIFKSDVIVNAGDRLVTLATCEYQVNDDRLVIVGKLVEK